MSIISFIWAVVILINLFGKGEKKATTWDRWHTRNWYLHVSYEVRAKGCGRWQRDGNTIRFWQYNEVLPMDLLVKSQSFSLSLSCSCSIFSSWESVSVCSCYYCRDSPIWICLNVVFTCTPINYHITFNYLLSHHSDSKKKRPSTIDGWVKWEEHFFISSVHIFSFNVNPTNAITSQKTFASSYRECPILAFMETNPIPLI